MTTTRRRIPATGRTAPDHKKRAGARKPQGTSAWKGQVLLYLEGQDPRLLDKETYKVYCHLSENGASLQGPIPMPVENSEGPFQEGIVSLVHRRLFRIDYPTPEIIALLEKLPLSGAVEASVIVEEISTND